MAGEDLRNKFGQGSDQDKEQLRQIIPKLEELVRQYEEELASQGGKDLEMERLDAEIAEKEVYAKVAAAISKLFQHIRDDVSYDAYWRHSNVTEHDQVLEQQRELEKLQKDFLTLSEKYDPKSPDDKIARELANLRAEIEGKQKWIDEDLQKRDANRATQGQGQAELITELELIKKILQEDYGQITDPDLRAPELQKWIDSGDIWAATLDLEKETKSNGRLKIKENYFENIGFVVQQDLETLKQKRPGMESLPEKIAGLKELIAKYKK